MNELPSGSGHEIRTHLTIAGSFLPHDGLGGMAIRWADALEAAGCAVRRQSRSTFAAPTRSELLLIVDTPFPALHVIPHIGRVVPYVMYESDTLPPGWAEALNRCAHVITPTTFCRDLFRAAGVRVPITVLPGGVDDRFRPIVRPKRNALTTLLVGTLIPRKNWDIAVAAWQRVAGPRDRLLIHARWQLDSWAPDDPRISLIGDTVRDVTALYAAADLLLAVGSEGYGLPLLEAMATGLPCIVGDYAGHADVIADGAPVLAVPADGTRQHVCPISGPMGRCPEPDATTLAAAIEQLHTDRDLRQHLGDGGPAWVRAHRDNRTQGRRLAAVLETLPAHPVLIRPDRHRIVIVRETGGIGDTLLLAPALRALRAGYPSAHVTVLGHPDGAAWLHACRLCDAWGGADTPIPDCDLLLGISHTPQTWRRRHNGAAPTVRSAHAFAPAGQHQARYHLDLLRALLPLWTSYSEDPIDAPRDVRYADAVILAPGSSDDAKVWPHWLELAADLTVRGARVVALDQDPHRIPGVAQLRGPLAEIAPALASARLVIGNDSFATHLAALAGRPTLTLFGPSQPHQWGPVGGGAVTLGGCPHLRAPALSNAVLACLAGNCFDLLPPARVLAAVEQTLSLFRAKSEHA